VTDDEAEQDLPADALDEGPMRKGRAPRERRCIATRQTLPSEALLRFVAAPDGTLVPDLAAELPGRGAWVSCDRSALEKALEKRLFQRGLKQAVTPPGDLAALVERLLVQRGLQALGLARRAGQCAFGFEAVRSALQGGEALVLLEARDGAEDGRRKLAGAAKATLEMILAAHEEDPEAVPAPRPMEVWGGFACEEMSLALGGGNVIHACLLEGPVGARAVLALRRLAGFRQACPLGWDFPPGVEPLAARPPAPYLRGARSERGA